MGINSYPLIIFCCIMFQSCKSEVVITNKTNVLNCTKVAGTPVTYVCTLPESDADYVLPEDGLTDVEFLKIDMGHILSHQWAISKPDVFTKLSHLNTLHITTTARWKMNFSVADIDDFLRGLFSSPNLEILHVTSTGPLNRSINHYWSLTDNLKRFCLKDSVMNFNLSTSNCLRSLSLSNCSLKDIPENKGLYRLTELNLESNTLENMTVVDLASFCSLQYLNIADAKIDNCECKKLHRLFSQIQKSTLTRQFTAKCSCSRSNTENCTAFDWEEVNEKRTLCLRAITLDMLHTIGVTIFSVFVVICAIISIGVFVLGYPYPAYPE